MVLLFGGAIERRFALPFLLLVLVSAAVSGAVQNYFTGPGLSGYLVGLCRVRLCIGGGQIAPPHSFDLPEGFYNVTGRACIWLY